MRSSVTFAEEDSVLEFDATQANFTEAPKLGTSFYTVYLPLSFTLNIHTLSPSLVPLFSLFPVIRETELTAREKEILAFKQFSTKLVVKNGGESSASTSSSSSIFDPLPHFPSQPPPPQSLVWSPDPTSKFHEMPMAPVINTYIDTYTLPDDLSNMDFGKANSPPAKKIASKARWAPPKITVAKTKKTSTSIGLLIVKLLSCTDLVNSDAEEGGLSDPYVTLTVGQVSQTHLYIRT